MAVLFYLGKLRDPEGIKKRRKGSKKGNGTPAFIEMRQPHNFTAESYTIEIQRSGGSRHDLNSRLRPGENSCGLLNGCGVRCGDPDNFADAGAGSNRTFGFSQRDRWSGAIMP